MLHGGGDCEHLRHSPRGPGNTPCWGGCDADVVMPGINKGERQFISPLDAAILADLGLPMRGPDDGDIYDCGG